MPCLACVNQKVKRNHPKRGVGWLWVRDVCVRPMSPQTERSAALGGLARHNFGLLPNQDAHRPQEAAGHRKFDTEVELWTFRCLLVRQFRLGTREVFVRSNADGSNDCNAAQPEELCFVTAPPISMANLYCSRGKPDTKNRPT